MKVKEKVQVVITTKKEALLLLLIPSRGGFWQNVTGGIDKGESIKEGALRELKEETGMTLNNGKLVDLKTTFEFVDKDNGKSCKEHCFLFLLKEKSSPSLDGKEHESFKWVKIEEVVKEDYKYESNWETFQKAKKVVLIS